MKFKIFTFIVVSQSVPDFNPIISEKSGVLCHSKIKIISFFLPPLIKMREWNLLFDINKHGNSMQTFYSNVKNRDNTVIVIRDENNYVFGAYCSSVWKPSNRFYGRGESFVFTFHDSEDI